MGRLTLNLSLFSNPNALGHSVIVAVPLLYFLSFWKRPVFIKEVGGFLMIFPLACAFFTQSKGAFMSGFAAILATLTFGRPKWIQGLILVSALSFGMGGLQLLPRFDEVQIGGGGGRRDGPSAAASMPSSSDAGLLRTLSMALASATSTKPSDAKKAI